MIKFLLMAVCLASICSSLPSKSRSARIVNGDTVKTNDWVVGLDVDGFQCGGSLIDNQRILTAAHCFLDPNDVIEKGTVFDPAIASRTKILINSLKYSDVNKAPSELDPEILVITADRVLLHPEYNKPRGLAENDIAIIFLAEPLSINGFTFATLPDPAQTFDDDNADVMGWGDIMTGGGGSNDLLKAEMKTITNDECIKQAPADEKDEILPSHICASGRFAANPENNLEDDSCQGDSGGPLRAGDVLIGVVGRNFDTAVCGQPGVPALYARVTSYLNWINQNTATNKKK